MEPELSEQEIEELIAYPTAWRGKISLQERLELPVVPVGGKGYELHIIPKYILQFSEEPTYEELKAIEIWKNDPNEPILIIGPHVKVFSVTPV